MTYLASRDGLGCDGLAVKSGGSLEHISSKPPVFLVSEYISAHCDGLHAGAGSAGGNAVCRGRAKRGKMKG